MTGILPPTTYPAFGRSPLSAGSRPKARDPARGGDNLQPGSKIFVGMSGGVDSSVSAALLQEQGHNVTGVFMKVWSPDWLPCPWPEERRDAMRVAAHLEIPFYTFDFTEEYKQHVVDYMIEEYRRGRVPNPDVMCNKVVKFDAFLKKSLEMGADAIATGHYSRVRQSTIPKAPARTTTDVQSGRQKPKDVDAQNPVIPAEAGIQVPSSYNLQATSYQLLCGIDTNKDQSYFLWTLNQQQLSHTLFPIGHLTKPQVRDEARRFNLPVAEKKDSQGVCFLGEIDMKEFLKHYIKEVPGEVVNESGNVIGRHDGVTFYTIGERRGFTITKKTPTDAPYYIIGKNIEANQLVVSHRSQESGGNSQEARAMPSENSVIPAQAGIQALDSTWIPASAGMTQYNTRSIILENVNWTRGYSPDPTKVYQARTRYRQPLQPCHLEALLTRSKASSNLDTPCLSGLNVVFDRPQESVASGQSLVLYDGEECLGGGIIV